MNYGGAITRDIVRLIELFAPHCSDRETLDWLHGAATDRARWIKAKGIFAQIRSKTLMAERSRNSVAEAQYLFEEICAKTLYNLCNPPAPFDSDSPYWILPNASAFARLIDISDEAVLKCVTNVSMRLTQPTE